MVLGLLESVFIPSTQVLSPPFSPLQTDARGRHREHAPLRRALPVLPGLLPGGQPPLGRCGGTSPAGAGGGDAGEGGAGGSGLCGMPLGEGRGGHLKGILKRRGVLFGNWKLVWSTYVFGPPAERFQDATPGLEEVDVESVEYFVLIDGYISAKI